MLEQIEETTGNTKHDTDTGIDFLSRKPSTQESGQQLTNESQESRKFLYSKGNNHLSEENVHRVGENFCQLNI